METYINLEDDKKETISACVFAKARQLEDKQKERKNKEYGLCADCANFTVTKTEFRTIRAACNAYHRQLMGLNSVHQVIECTEYVKKGQMSLYDMQNIAILIEPDAPEKIGF